MPGLAEGFVVAGHLFHWNSLSLDKRLKWGQWGQHQDQVGPASSGASITCVGGARNTKGPAMRSVSGDVYERPGSGVRPNKLISQTPVSRAVTQRPPSTFPCIISINPTTPDLW